ASSDGMLRAGCATSGAGSSRTGRPDGARVRTGGTATLVLAGLPFVIVPPQNPRHDEPTRLTRRIRLPRPSRFPYMAPSFRPMPIEGVHGGQTRRDHHG